MNILYYINGFIIHLFTDWVTYMIISMHIPDNDYDYDTIKWVYNSSFNWLTHIFIYDGTIHIPGLSLNSS
jgi:hypothetical protein